MFGFVAFLIGLSKGGLGGILGALSTPLMALVMPVDQVIGLILPILMFADLFAVAFHWRRWDRRLVLLLIPGSVVGVTIGTLFITNAPTEALRTALGVIVLLFTAYKLFEQRILGSMKYQGKNLAWTAGGYGDRFFINPGPYRRSTGQHLPAFAGRAAPGVYRHLGPLLLDSQLDQGPLLFLRPAV